MEKPPTENKNRFAFGANWARFLSILTDDRIAAAENSLQNTLGVIDLKDKTFLDIGSGSGLFSLAARRLGARVFSFDYDPDSVACTNELRRRHYPEDDFWRVEHGSILDKRFMDTLGDYDVVYSWGVLHHTGQMWNAIELASKRVKKDGLLYLAIYNDQGIVSHFWWIIKYIYNKLPQILRQPYALSIKILSNTIVIIKYTIKLSPMSAIKPLLLNKKNRGMSWKYDVYDWIGGFPFEFARYDVLKDYLELRGFELVGGTPGRSAACHEMIFKRRMQ
jgi:2-polyprenyl-3-methyl-5-hydroxy-6-metoxy-1,4-benzoquinol methylase